jgi:hypothetical protein
MPPIRACAPRIAPRADFLDVRTSAGRRRRAPCSSTAPARAATRCCSRAIPSPGRAGSATAHAGWQLRAPRARPGISCSAVRGATWPARLCHDPHALDKPEHLAELATPCGQPRLPACHTSLASTPRRFADHAHHLPTGPRVRASPATCPARTWRSTTLTRYHRIGSPTDRERVEGDRPLECALCHADKSVAALVGDMERLWGKHYDRASCARSTEILKGNALLATLERGRPHEQVAAAMVLAEHKVNSAAPQVARLLTSPYPLARRFAAQALAPCWTSLAPSMSMPLPRKYRQALAGCGVRPVGCARGCTRPRARGESGDED